MDEKIRQTLTALQTLSNDERAFPNERDNARIMFEKLCRKHGIAQDAFDPEPHNTYYFTFQNKWEKRLLLQVVGKITKTKSVRYWNWSAKRIGFDLTVQQWTEVDRLYSHYTKVWQKELDNFFSAFVNKHDLFPPAEEGNTPAEKPDLEKLRAILAMMAVMDDAPLPALALASGQ